MIPHLERLIRQATEEEQSSLLCRHGYVPRKGKQARRERDCVVDCTDVKGCAAMARKAFWVEKK